MKILIIRHGTPVDRQDTLTEKGWREVELLSQRLSKMDIKNFYVSPLRRAKQTASLTLEKMNRTAEECEWLREVGDKYFQWELWETQEIMKDKEVQEEFQWIWDNLDQLLAKHGYVRDGDVYRVEKANRDTIVFFCHAGLQNVLLSHLLNVPIVYLKRHLMVLPSSVTTLYTEEEVKGTAVFRARTISDLSHLEAGGEEPYIRPGFRETYDVEESKEDI